MKSTIIFAGLFLAFAQILTSCNTAKKVPYDAKWNAPFTYVDQNKLDGLDQQSRLRFGVINDEQFMYITLKTRDPLTAKQILTNGIRLTFSPENSREDRSIVFPVVTREDKRALSKMQIDLPNSLSLNRMIEAFNKEALWKDKQGERFINLVENQAGIRARIAFDENQELTQQFSIPFAQLGVDPREARMLEVGIKTEGSGNGLGGIAPGVSIGMGSGRLRRGRLWRRRGQHRHRRRAQQPQRPQREPAAAGAAGSG